MPDNRNIYVSWCYKCGKENRQRGTEVRCSCGAKYSLEWPGQKGVGHEKK